MIDEELLKEFLHCQENLNVNDLLERLGEKYARYKFVIEKRFDENPMLLREIALIAPRADGGIGLTTERIRQIEAKSLRMMRRWIRYCKKG